MHKSVPAAGVVAVIAAVSGQVGPGSVAGDPAADYSTASGLKTSAKMAFHSSSERSSADNSSGGHGTIDSANLDGSSPGAIVGGQNGPVGVAVDSDSVYWANPNGGTVNQSGLNGSNPHALFADQFAPYGVDVGP